ncbi:chorismate mutase [Aquabacter spiritensis]|uniref:chorismate mutase n=1 Tax=Aquabacter spiritensis TaxID=933073 RepID=A0A4R3LUT4_9HYPH|nr:chorismate mutase [Aquabacter spiritensis]TCT02425.1 isochorismate pyruvate lyase [Aquabacter spiritensis]
MSAVDPALAAARVEIDAIDDRIVDHLVERVAVVRRVVGIKQAAGIPALLPDRVEEVVARVCDRACAKGIPPDLAEEVWRTIIAWTVRFEESQLDAKE